MRADQDDDEGSDDAAEFARLATDLRLHGHSVLRLPSGGFIVGKWGLSRFCSDLIALRAFAHVLRVES